MTFWTTAPRKLIRPQPVSSFITCTDDELDKVLVNEGETQGELQDDVSLLSHLLNSLYLSFFEIKDICVFVYLLF